MHASSRLSAGGLTSAVGNRARHVFRSIPVVGRAIARREGDFDPDTASSVKQQVAAFQRDTGSPPPGVSEASVPHSEHRDGGNKARVHTSTARHQLAPRQRSSASPLPGVFEVAVPASTRSTLERIADDFLPVNPMNTLSVLQWLAPFLAQELGDVDPLDVTASLKALQRYQKKLRDQAHRALPGKPAFPNARLNHGLISSAYHFSRFATAACGWKGLVFFQLTDPTASYGFGSWSAVTAAALKGDGSSFCSIAGLPRDALLLESKGPSIGLPKYFVAVDDSSHSIVVCIRGTMSLNDVLTDVCTRPVPFATGWAHEGIAHGAKTIFSTIQPLLEAELKARPGYGLVIAGHSLGAATALLMTIHIQALREEQAATLGLPASHCQPFPGRDLHCYAYAPPPVFGPLEALSKATHDCITTIVHNDDIIPRLSVESIREVLAITRAIAKEHPSWLGRMFKEVDLDRILGEFPGWGPDTGGGKVPLSETQSCQRVAACSVKDGQEGGAAGPEGSPAGFGSSEGQGTAAAGGSSVRSPPVVDMGMEAFLAGTGMRQGQGQGQDVSATASAPANVSAAVAPGPTTAAHAPVPSATHAKEGEGEEAGYVMVDLSASVPASSPGGLSAAGSALGHGHGRADWDEVETEELRRRIAEAQAAAAACGAAAGPAEGAGHRLGATPAASLPRLPHVHTGAGRSPTTGAAGATAIGGNGNGNAKDVVGYAGTPRFKIPGTIYMFRAPVDVGASEGMTDSGRNRAGPILAGGHQGSGSAGGVLSWLGGSWPSWGSSRSEASPAASGSGQVHGAPAAGGPAGGARTQDDSALLGPGDKAGAGGLRTVSSSGNLQALRRSSGTAGGGAMSLQERGAVTPGPSVGLTGAGAGAGEGGSSSSSSSSSFLVEGSGARTLSPELATPYEGWEQLHGGTGQGQGGRVGAVLTAKATEHAQAQQGLARPVPGAPVRRPSVSADAGAAGAGAAAHPVPATVPASATAPSGGHRRAHTAGDDVVPLEAHHSAERATAAAALSNARTAAARHAQSPTPFMPSSAFAAAFAAVADGAASVVTGVSNTVASTAAAVSNTATSVVGGAAGLLVGPTHADEKGKVSGVGHASVGGAPESGEQVQLAPGLGEEAARRAQRRDELPLVTVADPDDLGKIPITDTAWRDHVPDMYLFGLRQLREVAQRQLEAKLAAQEGQADMADPVHGRHTA